MYIPNTYLLIYLFINLSNLLDIHLYPTLQVGLESSMCPAGPPTQPWNLGPPRSPCWAPQHTCPLAPALLACSLPPRSTCLWLLQPQDRGSQNTCRGSRPGVATACRDRSCRQKCYAHLLSGPAPSHRLHSCLSSHWPRKNRSGPRRSSWPSVNVGRICTRGTHPWEITQNQWWAFVQVRAVDAALWGQPQRQKPVWEAWWVTRRWSGPGCGRNSRVEAGSWGRPAFASAQQAATWSDQKLTCRWGASTPKNVLSQEANPGTLCKIISFSLVHPLCKYTCEENNFFHGSWYLELDWVYFSKVLTTFFSDLN